MTQYQRYRQSQYVTSHDDVHSQLNLTRLTDRDGGHYTCQATNKAGTTSHTQHIRIFGKLIDKSRYYTWWCYFVEGYVWDSLTNPAMAQLQHGDYQN